MNLLVVRPRLAAGTPAGDGQGSVARLFTRLVGLEVGLALAILAVVGVLTTLPQARARASEPPPAAGAAAPLQSLVESAGQTLVTQDVQEPVGPATRLEVSLQDDDGELLTAEAVRRSAAP